MPRTCANPGVNKLYFNGRISQINNGLDRSEWQ
uniref:Uncharacterized protein n=1 Tax=Tetranychus urticae TaxID=32264 RepID=T1K7I3_TETUR